MDRRRAENGHYVKPTIVFAKEKISMTFHSGDGGRLSQWPKKPPNYGVAAMGDAIGWTYRRTGSPGPKFRPSQEEIRTRLSPPQTG